MLSLKQIQISFDPSISQEQAQAQTNAFTQGVQAMRGCGDADGAAAALGATVVTNDQIRVRSLPEPLQNIILQLQVLLELTCWHHFGHHLLLDHPRATRRQLNAKVEIVAVRICNYNRRIPLK